MTSCGCEVQVAFKIAKDLIRRVGFAHNSWAVIFNLR